MEWYKFTNSMPIDNDNEIFIRRLNSNEKFLMPANEIWYDISTKTMHDWEWANANGCIKISNNQSERLIHFTA